MLSVVASKESIRLASASDTHTRLLYVLHILQEKFLKYRFFLYKKSISVFENYTIKDFLKY
jgi:hypothetical protein